MQHVFTCSTKVDKDGNELQIKLDTFLAFLNAKSIEHFNDRKFPMNPNTYAADIGRKFIRIVENTYGREDQRSVYCFLDFEGNIYKSASWKIPAKHIRGSIFDDNYSWGKALNNYGAAYLRG